MHLYERIFEDLKRSIDEGEIRPSERLPSIREVAARYGCNKLTAQRAFDLLAEAGVVENLVGSGSFVTYPVPPPERAGDFSAARLSEDFFPYEGGESASGRSPRRGEGTGSSRMRRCEVSPASSRPSRGALPCPRTPSWSRAAVSKASTSAAASSPRGAVGGTNRTSSWRSPVFPRPLSLFKPAASLAMGRQGPDPEALVHLLDAHHSSGPRLLYAVPDIHNPTGRRYSEAVKRAIVDVARKAELWIIEDDYLSELEPSGTPRFVDLLPERTIWIKSLSKTTAPGIRIGAISAPPSLVAKVEALKAEVDTGPAAWLQFFAERILASGLLDEEIGRCAGVMKSRRAGARLHHRPLPRPRCGDARRQAITSGSAPTVKPSSRRRPGPRVDASASPRNSNAASASPLCHSARPSGPRH